MKDNHAMPTAKHWSRDITDHRGFTLIELLVVVAVIALLIGILLPALGAARGTAWEVISNARKRDLFQAQSFYANENDDFITGGGTSGINMIAAGGGIPGPNTFENTVGLSPQLHFDRANSNPNYPTSAFDWASPALVGIDLPYSRAERMWYIWEQLGCPAQGERAVVWPGGGGSMSAQSKQECLDLIDRRNQLFPASSFMQPQGFAYWGRHIFESANSFGSLPLPPFFRVIGYAAPFPNPVTLPREYSPRISNVGTQSQKIALADGFRYHDGDLIDFDARIGNSWGSWADQSPIFARSPAYGLVGSGNPSNGANLPLSYRHRGKMGAVRFDGSARSYTLEESHNPTLWFPSRSRWTGTDAVPTAVNFLPPAPSDGSPRLIP